MNTISNATMENDAKIEQLVERYYQRLFDHTEMKEIDEGWSVITLPWLDQKNDMLEVYAKRMPDGTVAMSDDGDVLNELSLRGVEIGRMRLSAFAAQYGARLEGEELVADCDEAGFPARFGQFVSLLIALSHCNQQPA